MSARTLRAATLADAPLLADLGARTFRETFSAIVSAEDMATFLATTYGPTRQAVELADLQRPARILELEGRPVGFLQMRLGHREPGVPGRQPAELQRIYVLQAHHGQGLGAALMGEAVAIAREARADVLWLGVWEHNRRALAFYAKAGFREVGEHPFLIGDQVDRDLLLARDLP